jgi:hypothetical protein
MYEHSADMEYREGTGGRALTTVPTITGDLTAAKCIQACKTGGFSMAGMEYAQECCKFPQKWVRCIYLRIAV